MSVTMNSNVKHMMWSNRDLDFSDWEEELREMYPEESEEFLYERMLELNEEYLADERCNLDVCLGRKIICIASLGLWNGRRLGYKEIESRNIKDCLYSECEYVSWYIAEDLNFRCTASHHDGTNEILYRVYKDSATDEEIDDFLEKIWNGTLSDDDIERVTFSLFDTIANVYGFEK